MNIPIFFLGAYVLISPFFMAYFFKLGCKDNGKTTYKESVVRPLRKIGKRKEIKEATEKIEALNALYRNIDKFDGTGIGQEVIK